MKKSLKKFLALSATSLVAASAFLPSVQVLAQEESESGGLVFPKLVEHEGEPIEGGTLRVAMVTDAPFAGVLNGMFAQGTYDLSIISYFNPGLYGYDENFTIDDSGFADLEWNADDSSVTITIPQGEVWSDGEEITIDDVIFPYYVVGHPDYVGVRYGVGFSNVAGMAEYKNGETEEISGLERIDDYTLKITYVNFTSSLFQAGGGIANYVEPEHILSEYAVTEMEDADPVRQNPVGFGPFIVDNITPGEAVAFKANPDYYRGEPAVDGLVLEIVNPTTIVAELRAGNYDIATLPADQYDTYSDATNFTTLGYVENAYTYIGFKQGTWNAEENRVEYDPDRVVSNKALRQAMAYAIDNDAIGSEFYYGLRENATTHIPSFFSDVHNDEIEGYYYDPEKSRELLAEAGFVDNDGDGFVEDPNGEPFTLGFASMSGGEVAAPIAQYYMQQWAEVGINTELVDGNLMEFNTFYDRVEADDPAIDVYQAAWVTGGDPNPSGFYASDAAFNYLRWETEENNELLGRINSEETFDPEARIKVFYEWQEYMIEEVPAIPTLFRQSLTAVNKRVSNWDVTTGNDLEWSEIYLLAEEPIGE